MNSRPDFQTIYNNQFMKFLNTIALLTGVTLTTSLAEKGDHQHINHQHGNRPDLHAPISIMGDHLHHKGGWMISHRFMFMEMDDLYLGNDRISPSTSFAANYTVTPTRMSMQMQMLGVMYAPTENITLMAMVPYIDLEMDHAIFPGAAPLIGLNGGRSGFTTRATGLGDLRLSSLFRIFTRENNSLHGAVGVSLPTGAINEQDLVPGPGGLLLRQLPAAMQLGSGTLDILPSLTWVHRGDDWSAGAQMRGVIRTMSNYHDYRLGDQFATDVWISWNATNSYSLSAGLGYLWEDELSGIQSDVGLNPPFAPTRRTVTTAFSENYGGQRIETILGVNLVAPSGPLEGHRFSFDLRIPLWQDRNGIALGTTYTVTAGWRYAF